MGRPEDRDRLTHRRTNRQSAAFGLMAPLPLLPHLLPHLGLGGGAVPPSPSPVRCKVEGLAPWQIARLACALVETRTTVRILLQRCIGKKSYPSGAGSCPYKGIVYFNITDNHADNDNR